MSVPLKAIEAPLSPEELARRWRALAQDPTFEDVAGTLEITEWGEILVTPVSKRHGLAAMRLGERLRQAMGGHAMTEVGVATTIGVRAPDVAWCSDAWLVGHPEDLPLTSAPELCVEIVSANNALPKLREKAMAYVNAGAQEAWLLHPETGRREIYTREGLAESSAFPVPLDGLFGVRD
jgi:Uma2 family endonuclease